MHSIVCTKQVPDSAQIRGLSRDQRHRASGGASIISRYALFALEAALQSRDKFGGEIAALTTVDAERRAERGVQMLRTKLPCLVSHGGSNQPDLQRRDDRRPARGARAGCKMERAGGRRRGVSKCVVPGSPTIVKRAVAPSPRAERAGLVEAAKQPTEVLMKAILKGQPKLETDLVAQARRF
ncbi:hypothetical protein CQ10_39015 [Bradyrhizobium valentinum]|nr:hypothetical protein CQ10_39015 [Bradyrhizobium valentinum]